MIRKCAWCGQEIGACPPFDKTDVTHGMCRRCAEEVFPETNTEFFPDAPGPKPEESGSHPLAFPKAFLSQRAG